MVFPYQRCFLTRDSLHHPPQREIHRFPSEEMEECCPFSSPDTVTKPADRIDSQTSRMVDDLDSGRDESFSREERKDLA